MPHLAGLFGISRMSSLPSHRLDAAFAARKAEGRAAFVAYLCAGDPDLPRTLGIMKALEAAGADVIELGVPFSDPMADGIVNQMAAHRALEAGAMTLSRMEVRAVVDNGMATVDVLQIFRSHSGDVLEADRYVDALRSSGAPGDLAVWPMVETPRAPSMAARRKVLPSSRFS